MGVVVHNGSTLFSGDAGSSESNIRKWLLDSDIVEAVIQLPTDEFFNTGIYTYLWVLNKGKAPALKDKVMVINASEKFFPLKKSKGSKRKEIDRENRLDIVATLEGYEDNGYARIFDKEHFYFNKQSIQLTNVDENGKSFEEELGDRKSKKLKPLKIATGELDFTDFMITEFDVDEYESLKDYFTESIKPSIITLDYKEQPIRVVTDKAIYWFDSDKETLIEETEGNQKELGCGKVVIKSAYKKKTTRLPERIEITCELTPDYQKDYEIVPFQRDEAANQQAVEDFMAKYVTKPYEYLENTVGVEVNFNKVFYKPEKLRSVSEILGDIQDLDREFNALEARLVL